MLSSGGLLEQGLSVMRAAEAQDRPFSVEDYQRRLRSVRARMVEQELSCLLVSKPENIYYLTGLDHQGFFAYHLLVVPVTGSCTLVTRAMERATVEAQVQDVHFLGYGDSDDPVDSSAQVLRDLGLQSERIGVEKHSLCLPPIIYEALLEGFPAATWVDASWLVDEQRLVKSPLELEYTRRAAEVSDAMMQAALEVARPGVNERTVAARVHEAMILAGGEYPGFAPFIRPSPRLPQEHTTWRDRQLRGGEALFLEMAGCVSRYHAPLGRFVYLGRPPSGAVEIEALALEAFAAVVETIRPGVSGAEVYASWQRCVDRAGLSHYRRHHCGYLVGLGFPPSWTGGNHVVGLRHDSELMLQPGMVFHLMSWLIGSGRGDYFISNTAALTDAGCEVLTRCNHPLVLS